MSQDDTRNGGITAERERRQKARREQLMYLELGPENGGIVLNVSEGGIRFQAVSPLQKGARVHFRIELDETRQVKGNGQLVWTDESGRMAGLSFTEVSDAARKEIQRLLQQPGGTRVAIKESEENSRRDEAERVTLPGAVPELLLESRTSGNPWLEPQTVNRAVRAMLVVTLGVTLGVALLVGRSEIGRTFAWLGGTIAEKGSLLRAPAVKEPKRAETAAPAASAADEKPSSDAPSTKAAPPAASDVAASAVAAAQAPIFTPVPASPENGQSEFTAAQQILRRGKETGNAAEAVGLLWAAVEKGNTRAELVLANQYLLGEGVAKNCDQARVLLMAAAKKYKEAQQRLAQLGDAGCP